MANKFTEPLRKLIVPDGKRSPKKPFTIKSPVALKLNKGGRVTLTLLAKVSCKSLNCTWLTSKDGRDWLLEFLL